MAAITVRNLDESVRDELRVRAARHGRSMEAEVRAILAAAVGEEPRGNALMDLYWASRGDDADDSDLEVPRRRDGPALRVDFTGDEFG